MSSPSRQELFVLAAILAVALVLRAAYWVEFAAQPDADHPTAIDSDYHDDWAWGTLTGEWSPRMQTDPHVKDMAYFRPPGYGYFVAAAYAVFGRSYTAVRVLQVLAGLAACVLIWAVGRRAFGPAAGLVASALAAGYWVFIYYELELHAPSLLVLLAVIVLWALSAWRGKLSVLGAMSAGVAIGVFAVVRPNILFFAPLALAWGLILHRAEFSLTRHVTRTAAFLLGLGLPILPVTLRNLIVAGEFVPISSNAGMQLLISNHPQATGLGDGYLPNLQELTGLDGWTTYDIPQIHRAVEQRLGRELTSSEVSSYFTAEVWNYVREQPLDWLALMGRKFLFFWGPIELDSNKELHYAREEARVLSWLPLNFTVVLALAVLGGATALRPGEKISGRWTPGTSKPDRAFALLMLLFVFSYWLSFALFSVTTRYRLPLLPVLLVFAGLGVVSLADNAMRRRWTTFALQAGLVGAVLVLAGIRYVPYEPDRAKWEHFRGAAFARSGELHEAIERFQRSLRIDAENPRTHTDLANALAASGEPLQALHHWGRAVQLKPDYVPAHINAGHVLLELGRPDDARQAYLAAKALGASNPQVDHNLALLLAHDGDVDAARNLLAEARSRYGELPQLRMASAEVAHRAGDTDAAIQELLSLVRSAPESVDARLRLGLFLKEQGRLDEAVQEYRAAVQLQPQLPIARHNLAVALHESGDLPAAIEQYEAALQLRPDLLLTLNGLGEAYLDTGRAQAGLALFDRALGQAPDFAPAMLNRARALDRLGRTEEAATALDHYLRSTAARPAELSELSHLLPDATAPVITPSPSQPLELKTDQP